MCNVVFESGAKEQEVWRREAETRDEDTGGHLVQVKVLITSLITGHQQRENI